MSRLHNGLRLQRMTYGQGNFIGDLSQSLLLFVSVLCGLCVIVVYGQLPYDKMLTPDAPAQITMYGDTTPQLSALVSRLLD